jgi:hypothetical protein
VQALLLGWDRVVLRQYLHRLVLHIAHQRLVSIEYKRDRSSIKRVRANVEAYHHLRRHRRGTEVHSFVELVGIGAVWYNVLSIVGPVALELLVDALVGITLSTSSGQLEAHATGGEQRQQQKHDPESSLVYVGNVGMAGVLESRTSIEALGGQHTIWSWALTSESTNRPILRLMSSSIRRINSVKQLVRSRGCRQYKRHGNMRTRARHSWPGELHMEQRQRMHRKQNSTRGGVAMVMAVEVEVEVVVIAKYRR